MAQGEYQIAREKLLDDLDLNSDTIRAMLVSSSYTFVSTEVVTSVAAGFIIDTSVQLVGITITNGVFDASDATFSSVGSGNTVGGAVIYKSVSGHAANIPIAYLSLTNTATNGSDMTLQFDSGANKIFSLG